MRRLILSFLSLAFLLQACTTVTQRSYGPFVRKLDGKSILKISTYPAGFPKDKRGGAPGFKQMETHGELYFQVNIRNANGKMGPNSNVESIQIHSFAYQVDGGPTTRLLTDYEHNFWMQGNPRYEKRDLAPVPYNPGSIINVEINFTLNGEKYDFKGEMKASESRSTMPTHILHQSI